MKAKKKLLLIAVAAALAVCAAVGAIAVNAAETSPNAGKNGTFNGSPAHVEEDKLVIDEINFPDEAFRDFILNGSGFSMYDYKPMDADGDGKLSVEEVAAVKEIELSGHGYEDTTKNIHDISGIEFFTSLEKLSAHRQEIESIDVTKLKSLKTLSVGDESIMTIKLDNPELTELDCSRNPLSEIDLSLLPKLQSLSVHNTKIKKLDLSNNPELTYLSCGLVGIRRDNRGNNTYFSYIQSWNWSADNWLTDLDISVCTKLETVRIVAPLLESIEFPNANALKDIIIVSTPISSFDLKGCDNLQYLSLIDTKITELDCASCTSLQEIIVDDIFMPAQGIYRWDMMSDYIDGGIDQFKNIHISNINVNYCSKLEKLTCLDSDELTEINCEDCVSLTDLDLSQCGKLETLNCKNSGVEKLGLSACNSLKIVECSGSAISEIITSESTYIEKLNCDNCDNLTSINLSGLSSLTELWASCKNLESVDVSNCENLKIVYMAYPSCLTSLNIENGKNIQQITAMFGQLLYLDATGCNPDMMTTDADGFTQNYKKEVAVVKRADGKYELDLASLLGKYIECVKIVPNAEFDPKTGIAVYESQPAKIYFREYPYGINSDTSGTNLIFSVYLENVTFIDAPSNLFDASSDSSAEFPADDAGYYVDVTLDVEKDDAEAKAAADKQFETKYEIYVAYDVSLLKNGVEIQPKSTLNIRIPIPAELDKSALAVYHIKSDGTSESVEFKIDGDYVAFTVDSLSAYVLVDTSSEIKPVTPPSGGDETTSGSDETTSEPATSDPATTDPATSDPATSDPATSDPATTDPAMTDPATSDPASTDPVGTEPAETEPATDPVTEPVTDPETEPSGSDTGAAEPPETGDGGFNFAVLALVVICASSAAAIVVVRKLRAK